VASIDPVLEFAPLVPFVGLLLLAACWDAASLTIPNWLCGLLAALFLPAALIAGLEWSQIGFHVLFGFGLLAVGFFLFQAGVFGGGDAKLLAAVAVWTGSSAFLPFVLMTAIGGGVLAAILLVARSRVPFVPGAPSFVNRLLEPKAGIPYGVAIMAGGLFALDALPVAPAALTLP
jgi:prepilin peptidase CpaA